ncbi:uncharacterized protein BP01DRAFT_357217 [Aspergillus saccharolyticus JOP 1030-1]|uniref:Stc1 domain-containing protein n=1 Tax=Aspergillus saccharolyticus JOP 1030-1 TaxID=1450539 RepID=A0A318ZXJ4_9EURO|nr:hypothetical protein BP01DRAFT_357217 [Aspergillus saccharolyticus JOP 1030-1]PYH44868.1 hypothetical protein BP01DRAFT_357217 [Aspergillus saccharolyticus JOP 1030-1]
MSMTRKPPSAYSGGYSDAMRARINNTILPDKVKCASCKKIRLVETYSKRQQEIIRHAVVLRGNRVATDGCDARCRNCVGGSIVELKCSSCDKTKTLEHFAKNQRGDRDTVRCLNCVQNILDVDPMQGRQRQFSDNATASIGDTASVSIEGISSTALSCVAWLTQSQSQAELTSMTESTGKMNVGDNHSASYEGFEDGNPGENDGTENWSESRRKDENSLVTINDRQYFGHGPGGDGFRTATLNKKVPDTRYEDYFHNVPEVAQPEGSTSKWVRVPGRRVPRGREPSMRVPEPLGEEVPSDEDETPEEPQNFM